MAADTAPDTAKVCDVLLLGSTGYVAQFFAHQAEREGLNVVYGSHTSGSSPTAAVLVDFLDPQSVKTALAGVAPRAVVNAAAMSSPRACQENPKASEAINCPECLVHACLAMDQVPFLVHFSTDQVFDGCSPPYSEGDSAKPVNTYATHKAKFDSYIKANYPKGKFCILRPTNILGPAAPSGGPTKFLQWLHSTLRATCGSPGGKAVQLFCDEYRNYVSVHDVVDSTIEVLARGGIAGTAQQSKTSAVSIASQGGELITSLTTEKAASSYSGTMQYFPLEGVPAVLHVSGPRALTRVDVGQAVFSVVKQEAKAAGSLCREEADVIHPVPRATVDIGYKSPLNLSMPPVLFRRLMQREPHSLEAILLEAFN